VLSASVEAQALGIHVDMPVAEALERCPDVRVCHTRMPRYREIGANLRAMLRDFSLRLEPTGILAASRREDGVREELDGAYLEPEVGQEALVLAAEVCVRVKAELGLTAVAGIGPTRFSAYLAAKHAGEEGLRQVGREEVVSFLGGFPIFELWGLGPAAAEKLAQQGISHVVDIQKRQVSELIDLVGRRDAIRLLELATGRDTDTVRASAAVKSLSRERTLAEPSVDLRVLDEELTVLSQALEAMLDREHSAARTISLGLSYADNDSITRTHTSDTPLVNQQEIRALAMDLLARTQATLRPTRKLSLKLSKLCRREATPDPRQLRLL